MSLPYSRATTGRRALEEIRKTLQAFGCSKFAPMEDFETGDVIIQFEWRSMPVQVKASAKGYAQAWLRENQWNSKKKCTKAEHEQKAVEQGKIASWSILRDWIKGQITAVETGVLSFQSAFLGQILLPSGHTVLEHIEKNNLLPAPEKNE